MAKDVSQKVADFFSSYKTRRLEKKQTLIQAGFEPDGVYYLIKGQIGQCDVDQSGNEIIINVFKKGSFLPLKWAIDQQSSPFYFLTLSSITYVRAPRHEVIEFLRREPDVRINCVAPGWFDTDINADLPDDYVKKESEKIAMGRFGKPEEIASVVSFLVSEDAKFMTGSVVVVDGGYGGAV